MLTVTIARVAMTIVAIVLVYRLSAVDRGGPPPRGRWTEFALMNLVLLSIILYLGILMYPKPWVVVHEHDIFHYYMGSKYSPEVGYYHLYDATVVAESENLGDQLPDYPVRKMDDYRFVLNRQLIERGDEFRALFTPERWEEFKADVVVFREGLGSEERWRIILLDNGYNATPIWNMLARQLTERISVQWSPGMLLLASFDTALLVLMFVAVARTFGGRTAMLAVVFLGVLVTMADGTIRGAFLRLDWLSALVLATCALKRERYKTAGALAAFAAAARIFPVVFVFGLGAKMIWDFIATRRLNRRYVSFFVTFALVAVVLFSLSVAAGGGMGQWESFWTKIQFHDTRMSHYRVGFKSLVLASVSPFMEDWPPTAALRSARFGELKMLWWPLQALVLVSAFFAARRLEDYETIPFGWILVFFLAAPTFYYQVALVVLTLFFLPKLAVRTRAHGMALLFGISFVVYLLWLRQNYNLGFMMEEWERFDYSTCLALSALLLVAALYVLGLSLYRSLSPPRPCSSAGAAAPDS